MNKRTYSYRNYRIEPKRDFGPGGYLSSNGKVVTKGWVVIATTGEYAGCNIMPGGTWFETVKEAKNAIDVFIRVHGSATKFWEIMQPFEFKRVGQKADFENGEIQKGQFKAIIKNFRVVELLTNCRA